MRHRHPVLFIFLFLVNLLTFLPFCGIKLYPQELHADSIKLAAATDHRPQPQVFTSTVEKKTPQKKVAYLTFDDGPSESVTPEILSILRNYHIKATFFVIGTKAKENRDVLIQTYAEGHSIGNHTYDHDVKFMYMDPINFLNEVVKCRQVLSSILPKPTGKLMRFPGGSKYRSFHFKEIVVKAGYHYVDWNCMNTDEKITNISVHRQLKYIKQYAKCKNSLLVLMHDSDRCFTTVKALPAIIEYLSSQGFTFDVLT